MFCVLGRDIISLAVRVRGSERVIVFVFMLFLVLFSWFGDWFGFVFM